MRLLLDNNLSPRLGDVLALEGWDIVHVRSLGLRAATDDVVLRTARDDARAPRQRRHRLRGAPRGIA